MNCRDFDDRLPALLAGELGVEERRAIEAHAESCPRCRELAVLLNVELEAPMAAAPEGLAEAILARTSGSPCGRARDLLCDLVDGTLEEGDAELARIHVEHCAECGSFARALVRLLEELPTLADAHPGARFVESVLDRTSRGWRQRMAGWRARGGERWRHVLARPRFAAEGAYIGSLALVVLVGMPGSPLFGIPGQAVAAARSGIAARAQASEGAIADLGARVSSLNAQAREAASKRLAETLAKAQRDAGAVSETLRQIGERAARFVEDLRGRDERTGKEPTTPTESVDREEKRP